jgi:hypothetical protein
MNEGGELGRLPAKQVVKRHRHVAELRPQKKNADLHNNFWQQRLFFFLVGLEEPVLEGGQTILFIASKKRLGNRTNENF